MIPSQTSLLSDSIWSTAGMGEQGCDENIKTFEEKNSLKYCLFYLSLLSFLFTAQSY